MPSCKHFSPYESMSEHRRKKKSLKQRISESIAGKIIISEAQTVGFIASVSEANSESCSWVKDIAKATIHNGKFLPTVDTGHLCWSAITRFLSPTTRGLCIADCFSLQRWAVSTWLGFNTSLPIFFSFLCFVRAALIYMLLGSPGINNWIQKKKKRLRKASVGGE